VTATPDLDHVAIATTDITATLDALVGELGGTVMYGGDGEGFRWVQTRLGTATRGMTVESLVVWRPEVDDFLARFLDRHGGGAHHVTFKVPDLSAMIDACRARGLTPVGIRMDDPEWQEAFLLPRQAHGTVVQLAQTTDPRPVADVLPQVAADGPFGTPRWWPEPRPPAAERVTLHQVVLGSPERAAAVGCFRDLLGGTVEAEDTTGTALVWPGGGRIRVEDVDRAGVVRLDATGRTPRTVTVADVRVVVESS
jgi:methylmalonyl-CoA/ethylmalonyl-CoA epimerase